MTARWEPLETAEEVVAASEAGKRIEYRTGRFRSRWVSARCTARYDMDVIDAGFATGGQFRALIEDSK